MSSSKISRLRRRIQCDFSIERSCVCVLRLQRGIQCDFPIGKSIIRTLVFKIFAPAAQHTVRFYNRKIVGRAARFPKNRACGAASAAYSGTVRFSSKQIVSDKICSQNFRACGAAYSAIFMGKYSILKEAWFRKFRACGSGSRNDPEVICFCNKFGHAAVRI